MTLVQQPREMEQTMAEESVKALVGKTITRIDGATAGSDLVKFVCSDGTEYQMLHHQDCCESVELEDVAGDVADLLLTPILMADEVTSEKPLSSLNGDGTVADLVTAAIVADRLTGDGQGGRGDELWTFYRFQTIKGSVVLRWCGRSEYYSISVDFEQVVPAD